MPPVAYLCNREATRAHPRSRAYFDIPLQEAGLQPGMWPAFRTSSARWPARLLWSTCGRGLPKRSSAPTTSLGRYRDRKTRVRLPEDVAPRNVMAYRNLRILETPISTNAQSGGKRELAWDFLKGVSRIQPFPQTATPPTCGAGLVSMGIAGRRGTLCHRLSSVERVISSRNSVGSLEHQ